jgi:hypothetical protein
LGEIVTETWRSAEVFFFIIHFVGSDEKLQIIQGFFQRVEQNYEPDWQSKHSETYPQPCWPARRAQPFLNGRTGCRAPYFRRIDAGGNFPPQNFRSLTLATKQVFRSADSIFMPKIFFAPQIP